CCGTTVSSHFRRVEPFRQNASRYQISTLPPGRRGERTVSRLSFQSSRTSDAANAPSPAASAIHPMQRPDSQPETIIGSSLSIALRHRFLSERPVFDAQVRNFAEVAKISREQGSIIDNSDSSDFQVHSADAQALKPEV